MIWERKALISETVVILILSIIVFLLYNRSPEIRVVKETPTKHDIIYQPTNCDEYKKCFAQQLEIEGIMSGNWLLVSCSDGCRDAEKGFSLSASVPAPKNILSAGLMMIYVDGKIRMLPGAGYSRSLWRSLYVGGDFYSNGTDHSAIVRASLSF